MARGQSDPTPPEPIPECTHRPTCPGCPRYAESGIDPGAAASLQALAAETGLRIEAPLAGEPSGHRHRARLMVRGRARSPKIGLFQEGSHRIVDIPSCQVQHPRLNAAAAALKRAIRETGALPYADAPHRGLVRALQVVVERSSQTVQAVVVSNDASPESAVPLLEAFQREMGSSLHSLWWNGNPTRTNTILGPEWSRIAGPENLREHIGGADVFYPPGAFGQSHLELADRIVEMVHDAVPAGARVVEFHAGCGAIGLGLAVRGQTVAFNELGSASLAGLSAGIAALPTTSEIHVHPGPAAEHLELLETCDVAIVDPPRRGLEAQLCERLARQPPARLVYVACGLPGFLRDARALLAAGRLALTRLQPFVLFPFTEHVETLAVFDRR